MPTKNVFSTGAFVVRFIRGDWKGNCTAWYDSEGHLTHAVREGQPVPKIGELWDILKDQGAVWLPFLPEPKGKP